MKHIACPGLRKTWMPLAGDTLTGEGVDAGLRFEGEQDICMLTAR